MPSFSRPYEATSLHQDAMDAQRADEMMANLGSGRRERITTTDFKENIRAFVPTAEIQPTRLVNISGTEENRIARSAASQLNRWNTAYRSLKDDGTAEEDLREVNEGLGQTHRGKLQADDSLKDYTGEESHYRGGYSGRGGRGGRGGHGGGRGGGFSGQAVGHQVSRRRVAPVTRPRVVKGPSVNRELPPLNVSVATKESADLQAAREIQASLGSSSKQSKFHGKARDGSIDRHSQSSRSLIEEKLAKPLARPPRKGPVPQAELVSPEYFMAAIARVRANVPRTSGQPSQQLKTATASSSTSTVVPSAEAVAPKIKISLPTTTQQTTSDEVAVTSPNKVDTSLSSRANQIAAGIRPVANATSTKAHEQVLPDVSQPQPPQKQPIPPFDPMVHLRALEASGVLDKNMIDMLNNAIRDSSHARATTKPTTESTPKITISNDAVDPQGSSHPVIYTPAELKALRPKAESKPPPKTSGTTHEAEKPKNPFTARTFPLQPAGPADNSRSLAQRLADQRKALIGEHIHRTRFQPPLQFLIEGFKKLSLHDYTNTELATGVSDTTVAKPSKATENPFGSPKSEIPTPELPSHLRNLAPATDHGAAARAQYGIEKPFFGAPKSRGSGPELPHHLRNLVPATDHGAAVRRQYGIPDFAAPESKTSNPMSVPKAGETSPQPHRRSRVAANPNPTARPAASTKPGPALPAHLLGQIAGDAGAAARTQYGGKILASSTNNRITSSTRPKEDRPGTSRPQLPAHLRGQTAGDPGAAVRAQYGNVLAPVTNSLKPSTTAPKEKSSSPTKPRRGSKVNSSGFIGLAQARNSMRDEEEEEEEEEDPIRIASSRGF